MFSNTVETCTKIIDYLSNTLSADAKVLLNHLLELKSSRLNENYVIVDFPKEDLPKKLQTIDILKSWDELTNFFVTCTISEGNDITFSDGFDLNLNTLLNSKNETKTILLKLVSEYELNNNYDDSLLFVKFRFSDILLESIEKAHNKIN